MMADMNMIIANNIMVGLRKNGKNQTDLANALGASNQTMSKMLSGGRMINAVELPKIAGFLNMTMEELVAVPEDDPEDNVVRAFMKKVDSQEARDALCIVDKLADLVIFHARVQENAEEMMKPWRMA